MLILLADDQPNVRSALRLLLEQEMGCEVQEAPDAGDLLSQIETSCPDLVFMDWELTGGQGPELLLAIKTIRPEISVIVLSSHPEVRQQAFRAAADDFLSKGSSPQEVLATINKYQRKDATNR